MLMLNLYCRETARMIKPWLTLLQSATACMTEAFAILQVHYVLNNPPEGWTGASGFISSDLIKGH